MVFGDRPSVNKVGFIINSKHFLNTHRVSGSAQNTKETPAQLLPNFLLHILRSQILCLQLDGKGPQLFLEVTSSIKPAEGERYPRGLQLILILPISHPAYLPDFQNELTAEAAALHRPLPQLPQSREVYFL